MAVIQEPATLEQLVEEPLFESLVLQFRLDAEEIEIVVRLAFGYEKRTGTGTVAFRRVRFFGVEKLIHSLSAFAVQSSEESPSWTVTHDDVSDGSAVLIISSLGRMKFDYREYRIDDKIGYVTKVGEGWEYRNDDGTIFDFFRPFDEQPNQID